MIPVLLILACLWEWVLPSMVIPQLKGADLEALEPQEQQCPPGYYWHVEWGRCVTDAPPPSLPPPQYLPPPPGVIILRPSRAYQQTKPCPPGFVRSWSLDHYVCYEQANTCPAGFNEYVSLGGWRFCFPPDGPQETIPPLMQPPIAGIPYYEALAIVERHRAALMQFPGVESVGLGAEGIVVETNNPVGLPSAVEGLPIKIAPPQGLLRGANHSQNTRIRPVHGAVAVRDSAWSPSGGTLTAVGLSRGRPWLIFPTHLLLSCASVSPCPPGTTAALHDCPHNVQLTGTRLLLQPLTTSPETVGFVQRWDPLRPLIDTVDTAAAFLDNDSVEGNMSLHADRKIESFGVFSGRENTPAVGSVTVYSMVSPHVIPAQINLTGQRRNVTFRCRGDTIAIPLISQSDLQATGSVCFTQGDSGSPVLNAAGEIVGLFNWFNTANQCLGGGTSAPTARQIMGFEQWYGTAISRFILRCN